MDMVYTHGLIRKDTLDGGRMENSMALEFLFPRRVKINWGFGKKEKKLNGLIQMKSLLLKVKKAKVI